MQSLLVLNLLITLYSLVWLIYWAWTRWSDHWPAGLLALSTVAVWCFAPLPLLALLSASMRLYKPFAVLALFSALLYLAHFVWPAVRPKDADLGSPNPGPLAVLSSNLLKTNLQSEAIVDTIWELDADLVALQELKPWHAEAMAQLLTFYPHQALDPSPDHRGQGLLSKFPLSDLAWVRPTPESNPTLVAKVHSPQGAFWLVNMHTRIPRMIKGRFLGLSIPLGVDSHERRRDILDLVQIMEGLDGPALLVGDINTTPEELDYRLIPAGWHNAFSVAGRGFGFSYPVDAPFFGVRLPGPIFRIDHLFARGAWLILSSRIGAMPGSDHRYLLTEVELPQ